VGPLGVARALPVEECIGVMEEMFGEGPAEIAAQPARLITQPDSQSAILTMPSFSAKLGRFAVKIVTEFKNNPAKFGLPAQGGITILFDGRSAQVMALFDSAALTAVRTGAVSGLATRLLSRDDSKRVGVIGSGVQAKTQLEAVCTVRPVERARVYSPHFAHARRFSTEMAERLGVDVAPCRERREALAGADVVIAATNSVTPVLEWEDLPAGCHINSVGALASRTELAPEVISSSSVYVDTRDGVLREAGDVIGAIQKGLFSEERIVADLSELVRMPGLGRKQDGEVTLFKSVGFGLQDLYAASHLYDKVAGNPRKFRRDVRKVRLRS